eukprot:TRINITY_DN1273_c0_g1_i5.p1 TRINITY_DN1273_c0_g1~~TRINITY_DN1273_c0_g1_i5.p1  ORF type:complete len:236 (-),score=69.94 TRINITY_DN1273_c0_g1_i5:138-845(-)
MEEQMEEEMENKVVVGFFPMSKSRRFHGWDSLPEKAVATVKAVVDDVKKLKKMLEDKLADEFKSQYVASRLIYVDDFSQIATSWECTPLKDTGEFRCLIKTTSKRDPSKKMLVPQDVFSLSCSRPMCQIDFEPNQYPIHYEYYIRFQPNYPRSFTSEDVGDPGRFVDITLLTEGISVQKASFNVRYAPDAFNGYLELGVADNVKYVALESTPSRCPHDRENKKKEDQEASQGETF